MRSAPIIGFVLALGVASALLSGAGLGPAIFGESVEGVGAGQADDELQGAANQSGISDSGRRDDDDGGVAQDVTGDNEPTTIGFVLAGGGFVIDLAQAVVLLESTFIGLGLPTYAAVPLAWSLRVVVGIGVFQFITDRRLT